MHFLLLNGPNLNLLGSREPDVYGTTTLKDVENKLISVANAQGAELSAYQANAEHLLIERIHQAQNETDGIIINPGAFTHTSVAIRDALLAVNVPFIEVHISNVYKREAFRHHSYFSDIAVGTIIGLGVQGYEFALDTLIRQTTTKQTKTHA